MKIARTAAELSAEVSAARNDGKRIAFVPTMGALHEGHLSLVKLAQNAAEYCVVSIFVNPKQFNSAADLANYPRTEQNDEQLLQRAGVDLLFLPDESEIYPPGNSGVRPISAGLVGSTLEGTSRPGHFDGVLTVVSRLFDLVLPDIAVFGEKDAQQLFLVQRLVAEQNRQRLRTQPIQVIAAPTVRAESGLALSSRNQRLIAEHRKLAAAIYNVLLRAAECLAAGDAFTEAKAQALRLLPSAIQVDYLVLVAAADFAPVNTHYAGPAILLFAGELGGVRLIDNVKVMLPEQSGETGQTRTISPEARG